MPDEVNVSFMLPGEPAANVPRGGPTRPRSSTTTSASTSRTSHSCTTDVTTTFSKLANFGMGRTLYRLTFTFRPADETVTR